MIDYVSLVCVSWQLHLCLVLGQGIGGLRWKLLGSSRPVWCGWERGWRSPSWLRRLSNPTCSSKLTHFFACCKYCDAKTERVRSVFEFVIKRSIQWRVCWVSKGSSPAIRTSLSRLFQCSEEPNNAVHAWFRILLLILDKTKYRFGSNLTSLVSFDSLVDN